MCDPVTIALVTGGLGIMQGFEEKRAADNEAAQAKASGKFQEKQAEADAKAEKDAAYLHAEKTRKAAMAQKASARAGMAASGMDVGAGTALDIGAEITSGGESDAQMSIFGGIDALNRGLQAGQAARMAGDMEASNLKEAGKKALRDSFTGAAGGMMAAKSSAGAKGWSGSNSNPANGSGMRSGKITSYATGTS